MNVGVDRVDRFIGWGMGTILSWGRGPRGNWQSGQAKRDRRLLNGIRTCGDDREKKRDDYDHTLVCLSLSFSLYRYLSSLFLPSIFPPLQFPQFSQFSPSKMSRVRRIPHFPRLHSPLTHSLGSVFKGV